MLSTFRNIWENQKNEDIKDKVLVATFACYFIGFLITNLYLGSLGIVRLDIVRVKYIATALLFAVYYAAIIIPFGGFKRILYKGERIGFETLFSVIWHTFESYLLVWLATSILATIGGTQPLFAQLVNKPDNLITNWQFFTAWSVLEFIAKIGAFCFVIVLIIFLIAVFICISQRDFSKITNWFKKRENVFDMIRSILIICISPITILIPFGIFGLTFSGNIPLIPLFSLPSGWERFFLTSFGFYALGAGLLFFMSLMKEGISGKRLGEDDDWAKKIDPFMDKVNSVVFECMFFSLILGMYAIHVYPVLPQQIGGGKEIRVEVRSSSEEIKSILRNSEEIFLIDKSDHSAIFRMRDILQRDAIIEIFNEKIDSVEYKK